MKKSNVCLVIVMVLLMVVAWGISLRRTVATKQEINALLKQAEQYSEKTLFQKAIGCYDVVLAQKEDKTVRVLWVEAYKNAYADGALTKKEYAEALNYVCKLYADDPVYWEALLSLYIEHNDFNNAYKSYVKCNQEGATSELIEEYGKTIMYTYSLKGRSFCDYVCSTEGYYTVFDGEAWGVMDAVGEFIYDNTYQYISPYSSSNAALFVSDEKQRIMDEEKIIEGKLQINFLKTGTYANGIMAICGEDGTWRYMDCSSNSYLQGTYEMASNFAEGTAAVCRSGKWTLINTAEEQVCQTVFTDIKIHKNGDYVYDGVMIAAVNGEYGIYDAKGEELCDFKAKDMDIYLGGNIAFADASGKWGFVKKSGAIALEPQYVQANSFSQKLAAVSDGERWGFIDKSGEVVIDLQFAEVGYFTSKGTCMVSVQEGIYNMLKLKFVD